MHTDNCESRALLGFLMALTPVTNALMRWRGAGGLGAAEVQVVTHVVLDEKQVTDQSLVASSTSSAGSS